MTGTAVTTTAASQLTLAMFADSKTLALIQQRVARDATHDEFNAFIHVCKHTRLDPLRKQIYCQIYSKNDASKRQMVVVTGIDGYRAIAARTGAYRPGKITFEFDEGAKNPLSNPLGMVSATATVFMFSHGAWHECEGVAYYDEFAPITMGGSEGEEWEDIPGEFHPQGHKNAGKPKRRKVVRGDNVMRLDPSKDSWKKPRIMLGKCAEAIALRRAFPDDFAGLHVEEEFHRQDVLDLSASELVEQAQVERRLHAVGSHGDNLTINWLDGKNVTVPVGEFADAFFRWIEDGKQSASRIVEFYDFNLEAIKHFWAKSPVDGLEVKKRYEQAAGEHAKALAEQAAAKAEAEAAQLQAAE